MVLLLTLSISLFFFFFFNDTATTEIYTLSLHDALPILVGGGPDVGADGVRDKGLGVLRQGCSQQGLDRGRSEEHTSELQSQSNLVCRLLLEKKKKAKQRDNITDSYSRQLRSQ